MGYPPEEVAGAVADYVAVREQIERGAATWSDLARFFTDDIAYIDPAWGRIDGIDAVREFLVDSMLGLEDWRFPIDFTAIDGEHVVVKWRQVLPSGHEQSGVSTLVYGGDGRFRYEEDLLNMVHVFDDLAASGWRPRAGFNAPPPNPDRSFSIPPG